MSRTQQEIDSLLQQFVGQYAGEKPGYYGYKGECLSLAKLWLDVVRNGNLNGALGAPPSPDGWGSGYWSDIPPLVDQLFSKQGYNPNAQYPAGSLFVNTATHHIGILMDNNPSSPTATVFEQNADPEGSAAHTAQRQKLRIDGILVIRTIQQAEVVQPVQPPYTTSTDGFPRRLQLNKDTYKWDCNRTDFNDRANHPIAGVSKGMPFTAVALYTTQDGNRYYSPDIQNSGGFHISDCQDYVAPPPQPYVPPAPAVKVPLVPYYEVVTTLMYFKTAIDAKRHENALGTINKGQYVEIKSEDNVKCLVRKNTDTDSLWINTSDNIVEAPTIELQPAINIITLPVDKPPVVTEPIDIAPQIIVPTPVPVQPKQPIQWGWINDNHQPSLFQYQGTVDIQVKDLEGSYPAITMTPGTKKVISRYTMIGNQSYLLPDKEFNAGKAYGIDESKQMVEIKKPSILTEVGGDLMNWAEFLETGFKSASRLITDISPVKISHAATRIKQTVDGYKAGKRK